MIRPRLAPEDSDLLDEIADAMYERAGSIENPQLREYVEAAADALVSDWWAIPDECDVAFRRIVEAWRNAEHRRTKQARCLRMYEGLSPEDAAEWESTLNELGFTNLRQQAGRDVRTGGVGSERPT